jgi:hypothetical protein
MGVIVLYASYVLGFLGWAFLLSYLFGSMLWGVTVALAVAAALVLYKLSKKKAAGEEREQQPEETLLDRAKREAVEEREREEMRRVAMAPKNSKKSGPDNPDSDKTE